MSLFQIAPMVSREAHHRGVMNAIAGGEMTIGSARQDLAASCAIRFATVFCS